MDECLLPSMEGQLQLPPFDSFHTFEGMLVESWVTQASVSGFALSQSKIGLPVQTIGGNLSGSKREIRVKMAEKSLERARALLARV